MKQLHILLFIMIPFWNQAQHTIPIDSAAIEQFFQKVDRVELVEIRKTVSMRIISDRKGKITDTIITSDFISMIANDRIDLDLVQKRLVADSVLEKQIVGVLLNNEIELGGGRSMCYQPRNAILFYRGQKLLGCIELCFECVGSETFRIPWELHLSHQQIDGFKKIFQASGLRIYER
ncbi:hypothetical protein [Fluviicola sp.]|uniref:hypothetical protein n=1 Tax=Fluviicola sp. TaxID=1917219 RepID=UPI0031D87EB1